MINQQLILGSVYRVKFKGVFERHGVCTTPGMICLHKGNGVFRLEAITTFRTLVQSGVKLYDTFFAPLGISTEEYNQYYSDKPADKYSPVYDVQEVKETDTQVEWARDKETGAITPYKKTVTVTNEKFVETGESILAKFAKDSVNYSAYPIYKFVDVVDPDDIVYAPALTIDGFPEIEIAEYQDLSLVFRLGYFDDPTKLDPMLLAVRERLAAYGIKPRMIKLYSTGSKYMNPDEYERLRSVRLPANVVTIPEDAIAADYVDKKIIETNSIRTIVDSPETDSTQVSFNSLKAKPVVLDRLGFSNEVEPNDTFNGSSQYYELLTDGAYRILPPSECPVGGKILKMVKHVCTSEDIANNVPMYEISDEVYFQLAYNEPRSIHLYMKETTRTERDEISVDTNTVYRHPSQTELADGEIVLYRKLSGQYVRVPQADVRTGQEYYVRAPVMETYGTGRVFYENYASTNILKFVGYTFKYGTTTSNTKTVTAMTSADIINFAQNAEVSGIEMYIDGAPESNSARFSKYKGRLFRTTKTYGVDDAAQTIPVEIVIPGEPDSNMVGMSGDILGQQGVASREIYLLDTTAMDKNYYIQYIQQKDRADRLEARNKTLEQVITQLTA